MSDGKMEVLALDTSLDDIEDLPQFVQLPTGAYVATLVNGIVAKELAGKETTPVFEFAFTLKEVVEVNPDALDAEAGEEMPKPGDIASFIFQRNNVFGMGLFKEAVKPIAARLGTSQIGALLEGSKGMEVMLLITREKKKGAEKSYSRIKKLEVV